MAKRLTFIFSTCGEFTFLGRDEPLGDQTTNLRLYRKRLHLNVDYRFPEAFKLKKVAKQRAYEIGARSLLGDYVYIEKYSYNAID